MRTRIFIHLLLLASIFSSFEARSQAVEHVENKIVNIYENRSYSAFSSVTLEPGFSFTASAWDPEFFIVIDAQEKQAPDPVVSQQNFLKTIVVTQHGVTTEDQLIGPATQKRIQFIYLDGLARPIQQVSEKASPTGNDLVQPIVYNKYGQAPVTYLPYAANSQNGAFQGNALGAQASFYNNPNDKIADDISPFAVSVFDASPLGRIIEQGGIGSDWQPGTTHTSTQEFRVNSTADAVRKWTTSGPGLSTNIYEAGDLAVSRTLDENRSIYANDNEVLVFTDKLGRIVLKRMALRETIEGTSVTYLDTYYVYNDYGQLVYQIPPKAVDKINAGSSSWTPTFINEWVFSYSYDSKGRLVEKKAPDSAPVHLGYDPLDRLVLVQDGKLRASNQWYFTKYDQQGRIVQEGIYTNTTYAATTDLQTQVLDKLNYQADNSLYYEEKQQGTTHGYSNQSFPTTSTRILKVYYYDDYDFNSDNIVDYSYTAQGIEKEGSQFRATGMPTGSKTLVLDGTDSKWIFGYVFYDMYGQPIQVRSNNHISASIDNLSTSSYNFDGTVSTTKVYNKIGTGTGKEVTVINKFTYSNWGRLTQVRQNNNNAATDQLVAQFEYNELGQVTDKKLHQVGSNFLQSVDLRYNIQGWLTHINKSDLTVTGSFADADAVTADLFGMELLYNTLQTGLNDQTGDKRYWNGNVSAVKWKVQPDGNATQNTNPIRERSYKFDYDRTDRLKKATYQAFNPLWDQAPSTTPSTTPWNLEVGGYNEQMSYDHNGNILSLQRYSWASSTATAPTLIDNLTYTAGTGNQLKKVEDAGSSTEGFKNAQNLVDEYVYDQNGNLTNDKNKNTGAGVSYSYNELNKVKEVRLADGRRILYWYDGSGTRIRKETYATGASIPFKTLDYVGGFVYENAELSYFSMPEGRVRAAGTSFTYEYIISDHLGNARVSFEAYNNGTTTVAKLSQENHYYPYGMSMRGVAVRVATSSTANKNLFNGGSELQDDFKDILNEDPSVYSTPFREYDPALGRFNGVDLLAHQFSSINPYQFGFNNPISYNDPTGAVPLRNPGFNPATFDLISNMWNNMELSGAMFGEYTTGGGYHYYNEDGYEVGGYGSTYTEESGGGDSDGPAAAGSPYATVNASPAPRFPTYDPIVAAAINSTWPGGTPLTVRTHGVQTPYENYYFKLANEKEAYKFMLNMQARDNRELAAYLVSDPKTKEKGILVLPWYMNPTPNSVKGGEVDHRVGLVQDPNKKNHQVRDRNNKYYNILKFIHTHPHVHMPSPADVRIARELGIPSYIIAPNAYVEINPNWDDRNNIFLMNVPPGGYTIDLKLGNKSLF